MSKEKSGGGDSLMDRLTDKVMQLSGPIAQFAELPAISSIQNGLIAVMPVIIIGSVFLILGTMGTDQIGGVVLLPFLSPIAGQLQAVNGLTMNFMAIYCAVTISMSYAEKLGVDVKTAGLLGLVTFFMFTLTGVTDNQIDVTAFSATGLFTVIIISLLSVRIYKFIVDRNITIKMPPSVPPAIGASFTSLIPYAVVVFICWLIRSIIGFDMVAFLTSFLTPFITAADNIFMYAFERTVSAILWSVGLHGDNMWTTPIFSPFQLMWTDQNATALAAGEALPHIWTAQGVDRISTWPASVWPLVLLMITSKVDYLRTLGWACFPAAIFTIVEPVIFGLPLALNAYLMIPFILISFLAAIWSYGFFALGFCSRFFAALPWATPPFVLGPLGTGDLRSLIITLGAFAIGLVIYLPFWRVYEKHLLEEEANKAATEKSAEVAQR